MVPLFSFAAVGGVKASRTALLSLGDNFGWGRVLSSSSSFFASSMSL
jgi:hypothetical protein